MCTVTIVPRSSAEGSVADGFRMLCNRDESRQRPPALPPIRARFGEHMAIMPVDQSSGGTWIAVNDAGLCATLLNWNRQRSAKWEDGLGGQPVPDGVSPASRGEVIPHLLSAGSVAEAAAMLEAWDMPRFMPFRLVLHSSTEHACVAYADGKYEVTSDDAATRKAVMYTSSGMGDDLVERPRRELFDAMFRGDDLPAVQSRFHRHRWADRGELSVCMSRADAMTVSLTQVDVGPQRVSMTYWPKPPSERSAPAMAALTRHSGAAS